MAPAIIIGGRVLEAGGQVIELPVSAGSLTLRGGSTTPAGVNASFSDIPSPGWVQFPVFPPPLSVTLTGALEGWAQLTRLGVAVGSAVHVASSGATVAGLPQMTSAGMYTIRMFSDAGLTTLIGESGVIQAWAAANGPASAAITIDASSVPAQPLASAVYTITGTAVTSNNFVFVALGYNGGQSEIFPAEVVNGVWSQTRAWFGTNRNTLTVSDPSIGQQAVVTTPYPIAQTGEFAPNLTFQDNYYGGAVFTTGSVDTGYDAGNIAVSAPASWGIVTSMAINPIPNLVQISSGGTGPFIRQRQTGSIVPGRYTISAACTFSSHAPATLTLPEWFVPFAQPPTQAKLMLNGPVTDRMPAYTVIGTLSNTNALNQVNFRSQGDTFVVPLDNNLVTTDGANLVTFQDNIPAGTYTFKSRSVQGSLTSWTTHTVTVQATTAATISYTPPTGITNKSVPGTSLGTATTTMAGPVTWRVRTDRGYRVAIDPASGALSVHRYLSACGNGVDPVGENFDIVATNGTQTAVLAVHLPVLFPIDLVCHIGAGQQFGTFAAFFAAVQPNASAAWANGNVRLYVHPGTYQDDLGTNCGRIYTNTWITGIRGSDGSMPLVTSTEPTHFADTKGYLNNRGMDLIVEGLNISHARINAYKSEFNYIICQDDSVGPNWIGACELRDFLCNDFDDGIGRGQCGTRSYAHNGVFAYGPDGTGYGHCIYALGTLLDVRHVVFFGGSNGHFVKSRCDTTIVDQCIFPPLNNGSLGSLMDFCNGGNNTVTNCTAWMGPNSNNSHVLHGNNESGLLVDGTARGIFHRGGHRDRRLGGRSVRGRA